jgi:hypothetical protein
MIQTKNIDGKLRFPVVLNIGMNFTILNWFALVDMAFHIKDNIIADVDNYYWLSAHITDYSIFDPETMMPLEITVLDETFNTNRLLKENDENNIISGKANIEPYYQGGSPYYLFQNINITQINMQLMKTGNPSGLDNAEYIIEQWTKEIPGF